MTVEAWETTEDRRCRSSPGRDDKPFTRSDGKTRGNL